VRTVSASRISHHATPLYSPLSVSPFTVLLDALSILTTVPPSRYMATVNEHSVRVDSSKNMDAI
jgi:hypothetical protein